MTLAGDSPEDILSLIDALVTARCLHLSVGAYPTISITDLGERVIREQEQVSWSSVTHESDEQNHCCLTRFAN